MVVCLKIENKKKNVTYKYSNNQSKKILQLI